MVHLSFPWLGPLEPATHAVCLYKGFCLVTIENKPGTYDLSLLLLQYKYMPLVLEKSWQLLDVEFVLTC